MALTDIKKRNTVQLVSKRFMRNVMIIGMSILFILFVLILFLVVSRNSMSNQLSGVISSYNAIRSSLDAANNEIAIRDSSLDIASNEIISLRTNLLNTQNRLLLATDNNNILSGTISSMYKSVFYEGREIVSSADGRTIKLFNNLQSENVTWDRLKAFLYKDQTDKIPYTDSAFTCADYAERLHNNAEESGISAGFVIVDFGTEVSHACNVFMTIDNGLIFIDCTAATEAPLDFNADTKVSISIGKEYAPISIFPNTGYDDIWDSMGTVHNYNITW